MSLRILYLGQKPLAERCFRTLLGQPGVTVCGACSNADASAWWGSDGVRLEASRRGIPFVDNALRNEAALLALAEGADCLLSVQHAWVLSPALLDAVAGFAFNLHCAPLPGYKGCNACNHAILNNETSFAATLHWMDAAVDAGDAAFVESFPVAADETAASLHAKAQAAGERAFRRLLDALAAGETPPRSPLQGESRFYRRDSLDSLRQIVDPADPDEVDRKARAFWFPPFEPARLVANGRAYHVAPASAAIGQRR